MNSTHQTAHFSMPNLARPYFACLLLLWLLASSMQTQAQNLVPKAPSINATSYLLMDASNGHLLVEKNIDQKLPPASLTKLMTSYVIADALNKSQISLEEEVRISIKAWRKGGSKMYIRESEMVSVEDLLRGMIIQSGNDASIALAEHVAGSEEGFADLMNQQAEALGMRNSHFVNVTGWPGKNHYSSARDMAILTRAMIKQYPEHYRFYSEESFTYNNITQPNRNSLLKRDESVDGVKTGYTREAGYCLIASAKREGMRLISVVLGTPSRSARLDESQKLLTYGFRFFESYSPYQPRAVINQTKVWRGKSDQVNLGIDQPMLLTIPRGSRSKLHATLEIDSEIIAPIEAGKVLGQLTIASDEQTLAQRPIIALEAVEQGGFFKRTWDRVYLFFLNMFGD